MKCSHSRFSSSRRERFPLSHRSASPGLRSVVQSGLPGLQHTGPPRTLSRLHRPSPWQPWVLGRPPSLDQEQETQMKAFFSSETTALGDRRPRACNSRPRPLNSWSSSPLRPAHCQDRTPHKKSPRSPGMLPTPHPPVLQASSCPRPRPLLGPFVGFVPWPSVRRHPERMRGC